MSSKHLAALREKDEVLTRLAVGYKQAAFVGERIAPVVPVNKEGIKVPVFGKGALVEYETERAVGAASNVATMDRGSSMPIVLEEHDLAIGVDYREKHESRFNEQSKATRRAVSAVQLTQEIEIARLIQDKSVYAKNHTVDLAAEATRQWTHKDCDIQAEIEKAKEIVRAACGVRPNVMVVGSRVLSQLRLHPGLRELVSNTQNKVLLNIALLKNLLDLDEIIVGEAVYSADGKKAHQDIWGNFARLIVRPKIVDDGNDEGEMGFAYTFRRRGMPIVDRYDEVGGKVEFVRYTDIRKAAAVGSMCGYLFDKPIGNS